MIGNFSHKCTQNKQALVTDTETGEVYCSDCGVVLKEKIVDRSNDARSFTKEDYLNKSRNGSPTKISMFDMGNSSMIAKKDIDATGKYISSKNKSHFSRLRLWDSRSKRNSKESSLIQGFTILDSIINRLGLPENIRENSAYLYRKAVEQKIIRGTSIRSMISASVYASCKQFGVPRSLDEVADSANINRKTLSRTYRRLVRKLDLDVMSYSTDYVSKVANSVDVNEKIRRLSYKILEDAKKSNVHTGKNPIGLAAGVVYLSAIGSGQNVSMTTLSRKTNISTVTIRKISRLLRPFAAKYIETIV